MVVALAFWWAGWGWGGTGGWWFGRTGHQNTSIPAPAGPLTTETAANAGAKQPLTSAGAAAGGPESQVAAPGEQVLGSDDKRAFIGKHFEAHDVRVQQKVNDRAMWIGESNGMLAVVSPRAAANNVAANQIAPGNTVDAQGTVVKAPPGSVAKREWALSAQDTSRLEKEGAYIEVSQLTVPQQGVPPR